ncbi:hypothetical protein SDC9_204160 [bioreactor metagenome]|uniref:Uncharacterized protein n=1 Tax=bioreactor metagenome TaxID=1076179 RepID=A0A645IZY0_9ZZZZ
MLHAIRLIGICIAQPVTTEDKRVFSVSEVIGQLLNLSSGEADDISNSLCAVCAGSLADKR